MILSIVSGLLIWLILHRKSTRFRNKASTLYKIVIIPLVIISFMSTFLLIGYYQKSIFICNFYIPLSYPLEITHCVDIMLWVPSNIDYFITFFGYRIYLFDIDVYHYWQPVLALLFLGFFLFVLNYLSTCLTLFCIKKIVVYYRGNKE